MSGTIRARLRVSLVERYVELRDRLTARLGSRDLASEALHETWIRLHGGADLAPVANLDAYLYRTVLNSAAKLGEAHRRVLGRAEIDALMDVADDAPSPERVAIARSEVAALRRALSGATRRQRDIFIESYAGDASHAELAARYKVSVRTIQSDLRTALLRVATRLAEQEAAVGPVRVSRK